MSDTTQYPDGTSVAEALAHGSELASGLQASVRTISQDQVLTFEPYARVMLPMDGWLFWIKKTLLSPSAVFNTSPLNTYALNQSRRIVSDLSPFGIGASPTGGPIGTIGTVQAPEPLSAPGSLHITTTNTQDIDENFSVNRVVFTSTVEINALNAIAPGWLYIATVDDFKVAFSSRSSFYRQAGLWHYVGEAVYPVMEQMIIDDVRQFDAHNVVVSNSLPIFLALNKIMPMYPSFLVPDNIRPPYGAVDIPADQTTALQAAPYKDVNGSHWQLVHDRVKITMFGLRNFNALDYQDYLFDECLASERSSAPWGVMNMPIVRDEKRTQVELGAIALKKSMELDVSYFQTTIRNYARQLILEAIPTFIVAN